MRYFIKTSGTDYVPKNKLVTEIRNELQTADRSIIENFDDLQKFRTWMHSRIQYAHDMHPKCKPLKLSFIEFNSDLGGEFSASYYFQECHVIKITIYQENQKQPFFKGQKI